MEKILNIYLKTEGLFTLEQFIYLYLIYNKDYELADKLLIYEGFYDNIWKLSDKGYVKITNLELKFSSDEVILRNKGEELFKDLKQPNLKVAEEIFNHFKETYESYAGKTSRHSFGTYRKYLVGRVNAGVTLEDAKAVIDFKFKKWFKDPNFKHHLNFQTLLGTTHYGQYLQQIELNESVEESTLNKMG